MDVDLLIVTVNYGTESDFVKLCNNLQDILSSRCSYHVVCVDNFSSTENRKLITDFVSARNDISLLYSENVGYGRGLNLGIEFAIPKYVFNSLVVCNCDIELLSVPESLMKLVGEVIVAPKIVTLAGRNQNPFLKVKPDLLFSLFEFARTRDNWIMFRTLTVILRFTNTVFVNLGFFSKQIYAAHGAFIVISRDAIGKIGVLFDEDIFLLCEEIVLAEKARESGVPIVYDTDICVKHFEDASMREYMTRKSRFLLWKKSFSVAFNNYIRASK